MVEIKKKLLMKINKKRTFFFSLEQFHFMHVRAQKKIQKNMYMVYVYWQVVTEVIHENYESNTLT